MKNLIYLLIFSLVILFGCTKDFMNDENLDLKHAKVPIPMKVEFCATPNMNLPPVACMPVQAGVKLGGGMLIGGHATHLGEIIKEKSYSLTQNCFLDGKGHLIEHTIGEITADNGDSFNYSLELTLLLSDFTFTGIINMDDGTGRFIGVKGEIFIIGSVDKANGEVCWTGDGTMWYE
jgi:hypothetical protein